MKLKHVYFVIKHIFFLTEHHLVGGFNPFEKYKSKRKSSPNRGEIKQYLNHQLVIVFSLSSFGSRILFQNSSQLTPEGPCPWWPKDCVFFWLGGVYKAPAPAPPPAPAPAPAPPPAPAPAPPPAPPPPPQQQQQQHQQHQQHQHHQHHQHQHQHQHQQQQLFQIILPSNSDILPRKMDVISSHSKDLKSRHKESQ